MQPKKHLCWECTGSGMMAGGYPCKICMATGYISDEEEKAFQDNVRFARGYFNKQKMKYRKKPVVIEARLFTEETKDQVFAWIDCTRIPTWDDQGRPAISIQTLEGNMKAVIGDYVIKGVNGEFYPCKPDIFEKTYEPVVE